jgi:hypothetical protein
MASASSSRETGHFDFLSSHTRLRRQIPSAQSRHHRAPSQLGMHLECRINLIFREKRDHSSAAIYEQTGLRCEP